MIYAVCRGREIKSAILSMFVDRKTSIKMVLIEKLTIEDFMNSVGSRNPIRVQLFIENESMFSGRICYNIILCAEKQNKLLKLKIFIGSVNNYHDSLTRLLKACNIDWGLGMQPKTLTQKTITKTKEIIKILKKKKLTVKTDTLPFISQRMR